MDCMLGFLGEYISAAELVGKTFTGTISKVTLEKVESLKATDDDGAGKMKDKVIVYFKESKSGRGWLLNRTNCEALKALWGRETDAWLGKHVTLFAQQVRVGKKMEPGIRVKGSPDLTESLTFELKLPRKKAVLTTLVPTAKTNGNGNGQTPPPKPPINEADIAEVLSLLQSGNVDEAKDMARSLSDADRALFEVELERAEAEQS